VVVQLLLKATTDRPESIYNSLLKSNTTFGKSVSNNKTINTPKTALCKYYEWYILLILTISSCKSPVRFLFMQLYETEDVITHAHKHRAVHATFSIIIGQYLTTI